MPIGCSYVLPLSVYERDEIRHLTLRLKPHGAFIDSCDIDHGISGR